ncbi:tRNA lysidine(34) synthetase TilS [Acidibrevibacterium fodinaquatile]|uniref:tRNA lysidine(34) synthetase TilS n=1 Tax=Acidibrevibacterium fodinaquatile TaxID=1969806 RepID=UPI001F0841EF|nr:tRNA lysidine(34) synthetase TilS [Acidibrevibacterium fodinaquatile]
MIAPRPFASVPPAAERAAPPVGEEEFAALMAPLGPFGAPPRLALAVSGGADSMALALLAARWAEARCGTVFAVIVDHGLRPESAAEAALAEARLAGRGIAARVIRLEGLAPGPGLAARARAARYAALVAAAAAGGAAHLLLGHHAGDQAETLLMRALAASGPAGLAGMAGWCLAAGGEIALLRPLLTVAPARLRASVHAAGLAWVEDPSNADPRTLRARLRPLAAMPARSAGLAAAAAARREARAAGDTAIAAALAARAALFPEGYALLAPGAIAPEALAALVRMIGGRPYPPPRRALAGLAAAPRPATLAGVRFLPAGRHGTGRFQGGFLLVREPAALAPPVPARPGAVWDGRFRLGAIPVVPAAASFGALGPVGRRHFPAARPLPAAVLPSLPALRLAERLIVPHLLWPEAAVAARYPVFFTPLAAAVEGN